MSPAELRKFLKELARGGRDLTRLMTVRNLSITIRHSPSARDRGAAYGSIIRLDPAAKSTDTRKLANDTTRLPQQEKFLDPKEFGDGMKSFSRLQGTRFSIKTSSSSAPGATTRLVTELLKGGREGQASVLQQFLGDRLKKAGKLFR